MRPLRTSLFLLTIIISLTLLSVLLIPGKCRSVITLISPCRDSVISQVGTEALSSCDTLTSVDLYPSSLPVHPAFEETGDSYNASAALTDTVVHGGQFRIMFYGDSQLEGDRMTSLMRSRLCGTIGGTGIGLFSPVMPVMYTRSFVIKSSSDWKRYTWLDYRHGRITGNEFGPMLSVCRFIDPGKRESKRVKAWVRVTTVSGADSSASRYENLRILYGKLYDTVSVRVFSGSEEVSSDIMTPSEDVAEYRCALNGQSNVLVEFEGYVSPDIYAMSIESNGGVVVDNIPLRGSAGLEFIMTDENALRESMRLLKPDLIILQYGLNVVRNVKSDYSYYEEGLVRQIEYLKKVSGQTPILLVSLTDMADTKGDSIRYFSNIPAIRDAQKRAAARTDVMFWDAWAAMGGRGSVIRWAAKTPSLMRSDMTHLSNAGTDTLTVKMLADFFYPSQNLPADTIEDADTLKTMALLSSSDTTSHTFLTSHQSLYNTPGTKLVSFISYDPGEPFIFTSAAFWIFLVIVLLGFAALVKSNTMRNAWLLFVSLWFYYKAGGLFIILLLFTSIVNFSAGLLIAKSGRKAVKKIVLTMSIITGLGLLCYFKYASFITDIINQIFSTSFVSHDFLTAWSNTLLGTHFELSSIVLPVGISFFTFQALSYTIDVFRNRIEPVRSFIDFSFYVSFFPQLVAGPIVRASEFVPQMYREYSLSKSEWSHAFFLITQGLVKKMIISDFIANGFIDRIFANPGLFSGFENLLAVYGYGIQIYCDFSGYTDIAIGIALLMGFRLPVNFNSPYKASNITDFWKRWHISLSRWLKDYLYIPLGGNRKGKLATGANLIVTMLLGGLWHGASLRFLIWGGLHGAALVINKIWRFAFRSRSGGKISRTMGVFLTFNFVNFAWIFFRTASWSDAMIMINSIITDFNPGSYKAVLMAYLPSLMLILSGYMMHYMPASVKESYRGVFIRMPLVLKFVAVVIVCIIIYKVGTEVSQPFIYFRF